MMTAFKTLVAVICLVLATQTKAQESALEDILRDTVVVSLAQLPKHVPAALVAAEDTEFYDLPAWKSPLTVHLARLTLDEADARVGIQRIKRSFALTELLGHDGILEAYLNLVYFGRGATGIENGAQAYFGKSAAALTPSESVYLIMLVKAPARISRGTAEQQAKRYAFVRQTLLELKMLDMRATTHLTLSQMPTPLLQD